MSFESNNGASDSPHRSRLRIAIYVGLVVLLSVGLLWSGISGLAWIINRTMVRTTLVADIQTPESISTSIIAPDPTAQPVPINRIVFVSPDGDLQTITPEGSDARVISDGSIDFQFPAWSPTGEDIAAVGNNAVYLLADSEKQSIRQLYFSRGQSPFYLYWSPNGRMLSFLANHPQGLGLHLVGIDEEPTDRLLMTGSPFYWNWTADSTQLLIHTGLAHEEARFALLDVQNGQVGPNVADPGLFQAPGIAQSGRYWAYSELDENQNSWLVIADKETGETNRQRHAGFVAFGWSPVVDQLAFISSGEGAFDFAGPLQLMDAASGEVRLASRETILAFFWSPDGRYIAAIASNETDDEGRIAGSKDVHQAGKLYAQPHPAISLGLLLLDVATGERLHRLDFQPTSVLVTQFLPFFDQYAFSHRIWSPRSDALVLPVWENGQNIVQIVSIESGASRDIAAGDMPFWSHH